MKKIGLNELRNRFLEFFESKGHLVLPSFSLVPQDDPSILLINAGMTPLKPYFTGERKPPSYRIATCQKCIMTLDIDKVGLTSRHATFFEMLGNFSFGDYFKKEACSWAWEFLTEKLEIPVERLWVSIYQDDDEAYEIWNKIVGLRETGLCALAKRTTSGSMAPVRADPVPRYTSTGTGQGAASRTVRQDVTATGILRFGTLFSPNLTERGRRVHETCEEEHRHRDGT